MNKKIHNLKHLKYLANFDIIANTFLDWQEKKPNDTVEKLMGSLIDINYYITEIYKNELYYNESLNEYRSDKLRAIERAQKAEKKVEELEQEILKLKKEKKLGL
jgi:phage terminase large subunit-like protein